MPTTIPNRPLGSDPRVIADILEDFDALITALDAHIAAGAQDELPGVIKPYAFSVAPTGYMMCDGSACVAVTSLRTQLIAEGNPFGVSGANPRVPDLRGCTVLGVGSSGLTGATAHTLGQRSGEETHLLTTPEMPSHTHSAGSAASIGPSAQDIGGAQRFASTTAPTIGNTGGGGSHNNLPPYVGLNYIIKT